MSREHFVAAFIEAAPYLVRHRGAHVVVWLGEGLDETARTAIAEELTILHALGLNLSIVVGADEGRPPTDAEMHARLQRVTAEAVATWRALLARGWPEAGAERRNVVLEGNFVVARPLGGHAGRREPWRGRLRFVDAERVDELLARRYLLLLSGDVPGLTGRRWWIPSLELATDYAIRVQAAKLVCVADVAAAESPRTASTAELEAEAERWELPQVARALVRAVEQGVPRAHLVAPRRGALLTELFSRQGSGLMVTAPPTEPVEPARLSDAPRIGELLARWAATGEVLPRANTVVEERIDRFYVVRDGEGRVVACGAFAHEGPDALIEAVAVDPRHRGAGIGRRLVAALEEAALAAGVERAWLYTAGAEEWYAELGYQPPQPNQEIPNWISERAHPERASTLLVRRVTGPLRRPL